jgi:hypothetical protein
MPTPESPIPSSSIASTTKSTSIAPKNSAWEVSTPTSVAVGGSRSRSLKPSKASPNPELSPLRSAAGRLFVSGQAIQAANSIEIANSATTAPAPLSATTSEAASGPATTPALSIQPIAALPAVSSSGVRTARGRRTLTVGRVRLNVGAAMTANA